jgi:hypothetical protein
MLFQHQKHLTGVTYVRIIYPDSKTASKKNVIVTSFETQSYILVDVTTLFPDVKPAGFINVSECVGKAKAMARKAVPQWVSTEGLERLMRGAVQSNDGQWKNRS